MTDDIAALRAELERVEKERDKWSDHWEAEHEQLLALRASMDRARELAEKPLPKHRDSFGVRVLSTGWVERRMAEIARLLSGDKKPRKWVDLLDEPSTLSGDE